MKLKVQNIPAFFFYGMAACAFLATCIGAMHHIFILLSCLCLGFVAQKSYLRFLFPFFFCVSAFALILYIFLIVSRLHAPHASFRTEICSK